MANLRSVEKYGNQMLIIFDDGSRKIAYPSGGDFWIFNNYVEPPPPPPVEPPPPGNGGGGGGGRFQWPFSPSTVSSEYGPRNGRVHQGIDLAPGNGRDIGVAGTGRVNYRDAGNGGFGYHAVVDHGDNIFTVYGHMIRGSGTVGNGTQVQKGQVIGKVGNTGGSFGAHLHWETHVGGLSWSNPGTHRNPRDFMNQYGG